MSKFLDLLRSGEEIDCDLVIGGVDTPATFVWDEGCHITDYGVERFKPIMNAEYTRLKNGNIEIHCDNDKLGKEFCLAAAGYIGEKEYDRLFGNEEEIRCSECIDCQKMIGGRIKYRCYGDYGPGELKKDIGTELPETAPKWCPHRKRGISFFKECRKREIPHTDK